MSNTASIRDILDFWFLPLGDPGHGKPREIWWQSTPEFDAGIRDRFGGLLDHAVAGVLDGWQKSPDGALALILLCDQFPRNIHRRTTAAFSGDAKAQQTARLAVARFYPLAYPTEMRLFFYMPFQHSESLADQEFCCALFASEGPSARPLVYPERSRGGLGRDDGKSPYAIAVPRYAGGEERLRMAR